MRSHVKYLTASALAGCMMLGGASYAMAGADDGGNQAFFDLATPGSARGVSGTTTPDADAATTNAAATAQPNASTSRTRVSQARSVRPSMAGHAHYASHQHGRAMSLARHDQSRSTVASDHRPTTRGTLHAMHRTSDGNQS
jgi:hypothetical protein